MSCAGLGLGLFFYRDRLFLYSPCRSGTCFVDQLSLASPTFFP